MAYKRVKVEAVLDEIGDRELGRAVQKAVQKTGQNPSKRQLGRKFARQLKRRASWARISDSYIK